MGCWSTLGIQWRMKMMRRWHTQGNFCATQCVDCTEWSWWNPAPFGGGGTGGKTEKVRTEESMHEERERDAKLLPVLNNMSRPVAAPEGA